MPLAPAGETDFGGTWRTDGRWSEGSLPVKSEQLRGHTVLIVDDDRLLLGIVEDYLRSQGMNVVAVQRTRDALTQLRTGPPPDIILCDILIPDEDGRSFHGKVRAHPVWRSIPFVCITALDDYLEYRRSMNLGADGYLSKPFTRERLIKELCHVLGRRRELCRQLPVEITMLGGNTVCRGAERLPAPDRGAEQLVYYLLLNQPGPQGKQQVVSDIWGKMTPSGLRSVLSRARRWSAGWAQWQVDQNTIDLTVKPHVACDLFALEWALDHGVSGKRLEVLYKGELLPAYSEAWVEVRREALVERLKERFIKDALAPSTEAERAFSLRRALKVDPLDEPLWQEYIDSLEAAGMRLEAEQAREWRRQELD